MEEEKINNELEEKPVEKIGFNSPPKNSVPDDGVPSYKKKIKFSNQRKSKLQKVTFGFLIPAMIFSIASLSFYFMPVLSGVAGLFATIINGLVIIIPILATAFLILISEGYRQFVGKTWEITQKFFDAPNHITELSPYYLYVAIPAMVLDIVVIILCIITLKKGQKGVVTYLITTSIILIFIIVLTIIYLVNGMTVFKLK
ncbi:MAG: hypothetical protein E7178_03595 [Erysipelotrichaceae bacterium]|nr:hypothetical protein [Erysipelotrichaceae bacterium]